MNGSIQHRPDRPSPWKAKYYRPDGKQQSKSFKTKREAQMWLRSEIGKLDQGTWIDPADGNRPYSDWALEWLDSRHLKPKTLASYQSLLRSRINPTFGELPINTITPGQVRTWMSQMTAEEISPSRCRQALHVLRSSLEQAVADGLIARNPTVHVKAPTARPRSQLFLTAIEVAHLAAHAEAIEPTSGTLIKVLAYSGLRWSEAVALRRSDIDPLRHRVHVRQAATEISGRLVWGTPKNHRERTVVLPQFINDRVAAHLTRTAGGPNDLVFTAPGGGPLRVSNFRKKVWLPATAASNSPAGLRVHDLRHTAASLAISAGASIKAVQQMCGHSSVTITLDLYAHLYQDDLKSLARSMHDRYSEIDAA